ncbi:hypothetical protein ACFL13_01615 [Patescibacteria group bacterium]
MKFLKKLLRFLIGSLFTVLFLLSLGLAAIRFRLLNVGYWSGALENAGVYTMMEGQVQEFGGQMMAKMDPAELEQIRQAYNSGQLNAEEREAVEELLTMVDAFGSLDETLNAEKIQYIVERNLERITGFLKGKTEKLALYLPLAELGLPPMMLSEPPMSLMTEQTDVETYFLATSPPEQAEVTIAQLKEIQHYASFFPALWGGTIFLTLLTLVGHHFLGTGKLKQVRGSGVLLLLSGLSAIGVAIAADQLILQSLKNGENIPEMMLTLLPDIVTGFFSLGKNAGIATAIIGAGVIGWTIYAVKKGTLVKEQK